MALDKIVIKGAREHNLKNLDITIPRDKLIVITGLSGSGKSSLAFDILYAEGQRRYVESLSTYARQFLEQMDKPDVDYIEGLSPAIAIEQKTTSKNPRSTVGTVTEIYDYLRLLFSRTGKIHCYNCGKEISSQTVQQIVDQVAALPSRTKIQLLSPIVRGRKGEYRKEFADLKKKGFVRVRVDGAIKELDEKIILDKHKKHNIEVVIDRLVIKDGLEQRLADSIELALKLSEGFIFIQVMNGEEMMFSEHFACIDCGISYPDLSPRMFSFNNPYGACSECDGLGNKRTIDLDLVVPNNKLSLRSGAIKPWEKKNTVYFHQMLETIAEHYKFKLSTPFNNLKENEQHVLLYGSGEESIKFYYEKENSRYDYSRPFEGVIPRLERRYKETDSQYVREEIEQYMSVHTCPACNGARLRKEGLAITIAGKRIIDVTKLSIRDALKFFNSLKLSSRDFAIARRIIKELKERLGFLVDVGLDYLTLDRPSATLSGGEGQRIRLATQIGSSLMGVLYILDEPSIGL
ncbi:MAG TPA: excinuclease ABC subunit UvrA, partial [Nitrospinota bacterium]|nr:excinuclease ABC subunit UvrA [Nitrospinota bacterium]